MKKGGKKVKKLERRPAAPPQRGVMAIVPLSEIAKPEMYRGKMTLTPTPFTESQIKAIVAPTPKHIIKQRPGKGGGTWDYVPGWWFKKKANFVFGFAHDFEIIGERVDDGFITVKGKVTVREPKTGRVIAVKTDYGGAQIKYLKGSKTPLDMGNDFKAAATDAFKRCMVQFGFAMDIYGKAESVNEGIIVQETATKVDPKTVVTTNETSQLPQFECENCGNPVTPSEAAYSKKMYRNRVFDRQCQQLAKKGGPLA